MRVKTVVCSCSAGRRRMCVGLLKAPTWLPSTSVALPCGVVRNSNRFRGLAIRVSPSSTSHHVRGKQHHGHLTHTHARTHWSVQSNYCVYSVLNHVWLCFPGMWWPSVHWWTLRRTHRPSSSGTSWPDRKREASTARARHIGPFSSQSSLFFSLWSPPFKLPLLSAELEMNRDGMFSSQVESWWEVFRQDDHRHAEYLWNSSKLYH